MNDKDLFADPWLHHVPENTCLPDNLAFVCAYEVDINPFSTQDALYFRRTDARDELWLAQGDYLYSTEGTADPPPSPPDLQVKGHRAGCACSAPKNGDTLTACLNLIEGLVLSRVGCGWPDKFLAPGIVDESTFKNLVARIEHDLDENVQRAREAETEIIKVARELGLQPEPSGKGPTLWRARCPETSHPLELGAAANGFFCGYCGRKGGPEELRAFAREREAWRKGPSTAP